MCYNLLFLTFSEPDIWFDDVDEILLERKLKKEADPVPEMPPSDESKTVPAVKNPLVKVDAFKGYLIAVHLMHYFIVKLNCCKTLNFL